MWNKLLTTASCAAALFALAPAASAQRPAHASSRAAAPLIYEREIFDYARAGRPDPFRSLVSSSDVGVRVEDLALRGVVVHPDASRSVAVLSRSGVARPIRARVGERVGGIRILAIRPRSVEVLVEEFGVARRETLQIKSAPAKGGS